MCKAIYFDMDGTLASLYEVENWEYKLTHGDVTPYQEAKPLWDMEELNATLERLKMAGIVVGVISWLAIGSNKAYDKETRKAKKEWLKKHLPAVEEIHLVKYGTPKHYIPKVKQEAILIDDNAEICGKWSRGETINPTCENIVEKLKNLLQTVSK